MHNLKIDAPSWARKKVDISGEILGVSAWSVVWGGKFGPKVEPYYTETNNHSLKDEQQILWRPFTRKGLTIDSCKLTKVDGQYVVVSETEQGIKDLVDGVLRPNADLTEQQLTEIMYLMHSFPSLSSRCAGVSSVEKAEIGKKKGKKTKAYPHEFSDQEIAAMESVKKWHSQCLAEENWVTLPNIDSVEVTDPWTAPDAVFRGWLATQANKFVLKQEGVSEDVSRILSAQDAGQKPSHQGWETWQHAILSSTLLSTEGLDISLRRSLRVGMLLHDIGKTNENAMLSTGTHGGYGATIWKDLKPDWLTNIEAENVTSVIKNHDLLGLMDRAIKDPYLAGTVSPAQVRKRIEEMPIQDREEAMAVICALNDADIGSVSTLRYFLPLTPMLKDVVTSEPFSDEIRM